MAVQKVYFNLSYMCLRDLGERRGVASVPRSSDCKQKCVFLMVFPVQDGRSKNPSSFEITEFNGLKRTYVTPLRAQRARLNEHLLGL